MTVPIQLYANNAKTTLATGITATQTSITVAAGTGALFPNPTAGQSFRVTLVSASSSTVYEICKCTARSGDVLTVVRGQEGTSKTPFLSGDIVGNFDTAGVMADLVQSEQLQSQYYQYGTASGTANALTASVPSNLTTLPDGMYFTIISASANTAPATLNLTLGSTILGAYPIVKGNNVALASGDIPGAGYPIQLNWSSAYNSYIMSNPATGILVTSVPVGSIMWFPTTNAPSGYLITNGQLISRTTYASLWAFAQASGNIISDTAWNAGQYGSFSTGNGSTTFRLPQLGGYFIRNLDNGNGIDPARVIGTVQQNQNQVHTHPVNTTLTDNGHNHFVGNTDWAGANVNSTLYPDNYMTRKAGGGGVSESYALQGSSTYPTVGLTDTKTTGITANTTISNSGGTESRPVNISLLCCIKY